MIQLSRGPKPTVLTEKEQEWSDEHRRALAGETVPAVARYRYRDPEIKAALRETAGEKCMYCESLITHIHPGEIEHILPVAKRPDLIVDWDNLGFVCSKCNYEKLDYYEPDLPLIDPYREDPREHLAFYGPSVMHRPGSERGETTVLTLKLNDRMPLFERRKERIEQIQGLLDRIAGSQHHAHREVLKEVLEQELADDQPYVGVAREFVRQARRVDD